MVIIARIIAIVVAIFIAVIVIIIIVLVVTVLLVAVIVFSEDYTFKIRPPPPVFKIRFLNTDNFVKLFFIPPIFYFISTLC